jgi:hypothetical protein
MRKFLMRTASLLFIFCAAYAQEVLDLYPERPGALICWTESRSIPRPLKIHFLKASLNARELEVIALYGDDPDGAGPAESQLTRPEDLFMKFQALAAVNANAFAGLSEDRKAVPKWIEGLPVDIHGMVVSQGKTISPVESSRTPFWLDSQPKPHIGDPGAGNRVTEAVSDWYSPLLVNSRIVPNSEDRVLHPRTAVGFDDNGAWLLMVVVDGRQPGFSEGATLYELAEILRSQGCSQSINLDGGGSSIMLIHEPGKDVRTLNSPSDRSHRPVPVMLGVRKSGGFQSGLKP